jgi:hypothetical protein
MRRGHKLVYHVAITKLHDEQVMSKQLSCPRCDKPGLKSWEELNDEEREVVKRLPASAQYSVSERQATHRWCTRCWHEKVATDEYG